MTCVLIAGGHPNHVANKTSQELRMLSSVTINSQITKIVMKGSQLSELYSVFQMSLVFRIVIVSIIVLVFVIFLAALSGLLGTMQRSHITANCRL